MRSWLLRPKRADTPDTPSTPRVLPRSPRRPPSHLNVAPLSSAVLQSLVDPDFHPGPAVQPFAFSKTTQPAKTPRPQFANCFVCDEDISATFSSERPITLQCGDCIHEACLELLLEGDSSRLPSCGGHCQRRGPLEPVDKAVVAQIVARSRTKHHQASTRARKAVTSRELALRLEAPLPLRASRPPPPPPLGATRRGPPTPRLSHRPSASVFSTISREASPTPTESSQYTYSVRIPSNLGTPIAVLTERFIKHLVTANASFSVSHLLRCGSLRLVDTLDATDSITTARSTCYLFDNTLVCWTDLQTTVLDIGSMAYKILLQPSGLQLSDASHTTPLRLTSASTAIIEKWIIALLDPEFEFPSDLFTSTLDIGNPLSKATREEKFITPSTPVHSSWTSDAHFTGEVKPSLDDVMSHGESDEDTDTLSESDSDAEIIARHCPLKLDKPGEPLRLTSVASQSESACDSDFDSDSDSEMIATALAPATWTGLMLHVDRALAKGTSHVGHY